MKCPRAIAYQWEVGHKPQFVYGACIKEDCAWWDALNRGCCVLVLSQVVEDLVDTLQDIRDKMPHEVQFRK